MQKVINSQSFSTSPMSTVNGGNRGVIPPPQLPQQPQITVLGSNFNNKDFKQLNQQQQPTNQAQTQSQNNNISQPAQIYLTQKIQYQVQGQPNGNIQYVPSVQQKQSQNLSDNNINITNTYRIQNTNQDINLQSQQQPVPSIRNRFMSVLPGNPSGPVIYQQPQQQQVDNTRSKSSNTIINNTQNIQNNSNSLVNSRNQNGYILYNQNYNQQTRSSVGSVNGAPYGQSISPLSHTIINSRTIDPINETVLKHENKLKEILSTKNIQQAKEQNIDLCQSQGGNMYLSSQIEPQKYQRIYLVDNKIKLSPKKTVFKTVVTYQNQPQLPQSFIISQRQSPPSRSSIDSKSSLSHSFRPIQVVQDRQIKELSRPINIIEKANQLNVSNPNNQYNSSSSVVIQSPVHYRGFLDQELKQNQIPSALTQSPPSQDRSSQVYQQAAMYAQPQMSQSQNSTQFMIFQQQKDQKPLTDIQKLYLEKNQKQEVSKQSPALSFAQTPNNVQSRRGSNQTDFTLNPPNQQNTPQYPPTISPNLISHQIYPQQLPNESPSLSPINNLRINPLENKQEQQSITNYLSSTQDNTSKAQTTLSNNPFPNQSNIKNSEQSNSINDTYQYSLNNFLTQKRPTIPAIINTSSTPMTSQQPIIQSPVIQSPIISNYQSNQQDEQVKKSFIYQLNPTGQASPKTSSPNNQNQQNQDQQQKFTQNTYQTSNYPQLQNFVTQSQINSTPIIQSPPIKSAFVQNPQFYQSSLIQSPINTAIQQNQLTPDKNFKGTQSPSLSSQPQPYQSQNTGGIQLLNQPISSYQKSQPQSQTQVQNPLMSLTTIPSYTPLLYPAYKGIESPSNSLAQQRVFLSRQPSLEKIRQSSHSPAKSVYSDIGKTVYPQSPYTVIENQINQLRNQSSRHPSQENIRNSSVSPAPSATSDQGKQITVSQNTQSNGQLIQSIIQTNTAQVNAPIISNIITSSPEGVRTQKIQVQHTASIPLAGGFQLNTQVTTEHEVKDIPNYIKNSTSDNVKVVENVIIDNQQILQNSFTQNPNKMFTFQTYSSPFPQTNPNMILYKYPNQVQQVINQQNLFTNSPVRNHHDLNNNSSSFNQQELQRIVGQFDSEGDQYQDIINQIGYQPKQENSKEGVSFLSNQPSLEQYKLGQLLQGQDCYNDELSVNQVKNIYISDPEKQNQEVLPQDSKTSGENRKRNFSFQDGNQQKGEKGGNQDQQQGNIIQENIDLLIGNIFKEALNNVNENINNMRNELNQQVQSKVNDQQLQQRLKSQSEEKLKQLNQLSQQVTSQPQQNCQNQQKQNSQQNERQQVTPQLMQQNQIQYQQNILQGQSQQYQTPKQAVQTQLNDQNQQMKQQQNNQQQQQQYLPSYQPVQYPDEVLEIQYQGQNQNKQPTYVQNNLNTIDELDNDALSVFKKIQNGNNIHVPMNDAQKKELAQSWQKPDIVQQLILEQLNQEKKQLKQVGSKTNLGNSLTQFSKPIGKSSSNNLSSMRSDSFSMLPKSRDSSVGVEKKDDSDFFRVKRFSNSKKEKSEQQFSQPPQTEQLFYNNAPHSLSHSPNNLESLIHKQKFNPLVKKPSQERAFPFFQPSQAQNSRNKSSSINNSLANSRQASAEKQRSIIERIENTFEEAQPTDGKTSFSFQQHNSALKSDDKKKKLNNYKSVTQFQQPYPSIQQQFQESNKSISPSKKEQNTTNSQRLDNQIEEPQQLQYVPQQYPSNEQTDVMLIPEYLESEKDKKYREFLLKMLNNYQEKRQDTFITLTCQIQQFHLKRGEILLKIDKLNKKQQIEQIQQGSPFARKGQDNVPPQKLTYVAQKIDDGNIQQIDQLKKSKRQMSNISNIYDSNKKLPKKKFDMNNYMGYAFSENEFQEQIQQFEELRQDDPGSPGNARRNKEALMNSLTHHSPDQKQDNEIQSNQRNSYKTNQEEFEHLEQYNQSISKGRKLRTCQLQKILDEKQKSNSPNKQPYQHEYYQSAKFKKSPKKSQSPRNIPSDDQSPNSKSSHTPSSRQNVINKQYNNNKNVVQSQQNNQVKRRISDSQSSQANNQSYNKSPNRVTNSNKSQTLNKNSKGREDRQRKEQIPRQLQNSSKIKENNQQRDQSKLEKQSSIPIKGQAAEQTKNSKNLRNQTSKEISELQLQQQQRKTQSYQFDEQQQYSEIMYPYSQSENILPISQQQNRTYQKLNVLPSNTFESQTYYTKDDSQPNIQVDQKNKNFTKPTSSHINKIKSKPLVQIKKSATPSKSPLNRKQVPKQISQIRQFEQNKQFPQLKQQSQESNKRRLSPKNLIQNISDLQKYSEYMVANNQNLLKELDHSLDRSRNNSSQLNRSRNNSNSLGRSIIKEIGSFFKYQQDQEKSPKSRSKVESYSRINQYEDEEFLQNGGSSPERSPDQTLDQNQQKSSNPNKNKLYVQIRKTIHSISPPNSKNQQQGNYLHLPQYSSNIAQYEGHQQLNLNNIQEDKEQEDTCPSQRNNQDIDLQQIQNIIQQNNQQIKKKLQL